MLRAATQLNINIVYRYKSDQVPEIEDENLKKNIREAVKAAKLTEAADATREAFKKEIRKTSGSSDLYSLRPGSEAYKNAIKKIMAEVNDIVRDMIIKEEYLLPRKSYSIAVGGSYERMRIFKLNSIFITCKSCRFHAVLICINS